MNNFYLKSGDVLVNVNDRQDLYSRVKRWAVGPYDHVFLFMGSLGVLATIKQPRLIRIPMIFESIGRGVLLRSLSERYEEKVVVLRLSSEHDRRRITRILEEAINLASNPQSYYDYLCVVKYILPRLILEKMPAFIQEKIPLRWHRDLWHVCSEAVYEAFYRANIVDIIFPHCIPPLPGDFVTDSFLLEKVWEGNLSDEIVERR